MSERIEKSLINCARAHAELQDYIAQSSGSKRDRAAVIQAFEFSFEVFWKHFKKLSEEQGVNTSTPKQAVAEAFKQGTVSNELVWLGMLKDRNLTSHVYNDLVSSEIYGRIVNLYAPAFAETLKILMLKPGVGG